MSHNHEIMTHNYDHISTYSDQGVYSPSNTSSMEIDEKEINLLSCTNEQFDATLDHLFNL